jgi:hypothetical protein
MRRLSRGQPEISILISLLALSANKDLDGFPAKTFKTDGFLV